MLVKYLSIIRNYVLSASSQRKYNFYHQNMLLDAFRTTSRNIIGRNPSMVIPLLANQDLTPMLVLLTYLFIYLFPLFSQGSLCRFCLFHVSYIFSFFRSVFFTLMMDPGK